MRWLSQGVCSLLSHVPWAVRAARHSFSVGECRRAEYGSSSTPRRRGESKPRRTELGQYKCRAGARPSSAWRHPDCFTCRRKSRDFATDRAGRLWTSIALNPGDIPFGLWRSSAWGHADGSAPGDRTSAASPGPATARCVSGAWHPTHGGSSARPRADGFAPGDQGLQPALPGFGTRDGLRAWHPTHGGSSAGRVLTARPGRTESRRPSRVRHGAMFSGAWHPTHGGSSARPRADGFAPGDRGSSGLPRVRHGTVSLRAICQAGRRDKSDRRPGGGCTSGANTGALALLRGSRFARVGLACATALAVATRRADLGELNLRLSTYWHARSGFGRTGMLPGGFPSLIPVLTPAALGRSCHREERSDAAIQESRGSPSAPLDCWGGRPLSGICVR